MGQETTKIFSQNLGVNKRAHIQAVSQASGFDGKEHMKNGELLFIFDYLL